MAALTESALKAHSSGEDDRMAALLERTKVLSSLLGQVNAAMREEGCDITDTESSRPQSSCRASTGRPTSSRPPSSRPTPARSASGRPESGRSAPATGRPTSAAQQPGAAPPMMRLTHGYEGDKPSAIDRFLGSSSRQPKPQTHAHALADANGAEDVLQLYDDGRRVLQCAPVGGPANDENAPVKFVRYTGRQTATAGFGASRKKVDSRAAQSSVGGLVFGGGA